MLKGIRVKNLKGFLDTGYIQLRPINILVGANSSGKSSFARIFPLLRQSVEYKTHGPILWYSRVDFGDFNNALSNYREEGDDRISFTFDIEIDPKTLPRLFVSRLQLENKTRSQVTLTISQGKKTKPAFPEELCFEIFDNKLVLKFGSSGKIENITINNSYFDISDSDDYSYYQGNLLPIPSLLNETMGRYRGKRRSFLKESTYPEKILYKKIKRFVHGRTEDPTIQSIIKRLPVANDQDLKVMLSNMPNTPNSWKYKIGNASTEQNPFKELRDSIFLLRMPELLLMADRTIGEFFFGIAYLEPLRAIASRYYRPQELAVDEIDSKGTNLPVYLDSLTETQRKQFEEWVFKALGWRVSAVREGGHLSLKITEKGKVAQNLADVGFGYSQILPIVVQLWHLNFSIESRRSPYRNQSNCFVVEQPELHLHPKFQAKLADVFISPYEKSKQEGKNFITIAETHSPHLINRIGSLIEEGELDNEDVQVLLFEDEANKGNTVRSVNFDNYGFLEDWPYGFFDPEN